MGGEEHLMELMQHKRRLNKELVVLVEILSDIDEKIAAILAADRENG